VKLGVESSTWMGTSLAQTALWLTLQQPEGFLPHSLECTAADPPRKLATAFRLAQEMIRRLYAHPSGSLPTGPPIRRYRLRRGRCDAAARPDRDHGSRKTLPELQTPDPRCCSHPDAVIPPEMGISTRS